MPTCRSGFPVRSDDDHGSGVAEVERPISGLADRTVRGGRLPCDWQWFSNGPAGRCATGLLSNDRARRRPRCLCRSSGLGRTADHLPQCWRTGRRLLADPGTERTRCPRTTSSACGNGCGAGKSWRAKPWTVCPATEYTAGRHLTIRQGEPFNVRMTHGMSFEVR